jgi:hypothetical protein
MQEHRGKERKEQKVCVGLFSPSLSSSTVVAVMAAATKPVSEVQQLAACQSEAQKPWYRPSPSNQTGNTLQMYPATYCFGDVLSDVSKQFKLRKLRESPSHGD